MKEELFNKIIEYLQNNTFLGYPCKRKETENYISYSFSFVTHTRAERMRQLRDVLKYYGWKYCPEVQPYFEGMTAIYTTYYTAIYNKNRDSISFGALDVGIRWAYRKGRIYPAKQFRRIFTYSKNMYGFIYNQPRISLGLNGANYGIFEKVIKHVIFDRRVDVDVYCRIPAIYFLGRSKDSVWDIMETYLGRSISPQIRDRENYRSPNFSHYAVLELYKNLFGTKKRPNKYIEIYLNGEPL